MKAVEARVRAMNPTERRLCLLDHDWARGRNDSDWRHPRYAGGYTLAAAIRLALGESK